MKKYASLILILTCNVSFAVVNNHITYDIRGVSGKVLENVKMRITELEQQNPNTADSEELIHQVEQAVKPYGYFDSSADIFKINRSKVSVMVHPGPRTHIASLSVKIIGEGAHQAQLLKILKESPIHVGDPLLTEKYLQLKSALSDTAENLGYLHNTFSKAEILVDVINAKADITLVFDTGYLFYFGQVQFDPTNVSPHLLHRFVPFYPGQPYSTQETIKLNNYLSDSRYFSTVLVEPQVGDGQMVPVFVHLNPVSKYSYSLGAGYGTDTGVRGRAGLHVVPVNQQGHKFNVLAQGSFVQNAFQLQYVIPGHNPVTDQYNITSNFSNYNYGVGYGNAFLISLAHQHNTDHFKKNISINGLSEGFYYKTQSNENKLMFYPKASFTFIKKDNALFSPSGYNITLGGLGSSKALLSKLNTLQASIDAKVAYTIERLRLRLYGHTIQGFTAINNITDLPLSIALLLGGNENLKGFSFNSIGPGKIITYAGIEVQKETIKNWFLVGLFDVGDVYKPSVRNSQYDLGAALMWVSPVGPIKVGFAQPVNNQLHKTQASPRLLINIGSSL